MTSVSNSFESHSTEKAETREQRSEANVAINNLPVFPPPPLNESGWLHGGHPGITAANVILTPPAWEQIIEHSRSNLASELGGVLLGRAYRANNTVFVEISAALPAASQDRSAVHFTFSADSWSQFHQDKAAKYPDLETVGWFHTHPGFGVFYSSDDIVVHSAAFTLPWHVGLVVDPIQEEISFFGWVNGVLEPLNGFFEIVPTGEEPVVKYQAISSTVWTDYDERTIVERGNVYIAPRAATALPSIRSRTTLILSTIALVIGFFLVVLWAIPLAVRINNLEITTVNRLNASFPNNEMSSCPDPKLRIHYPLGGDQFSVGSEISIIGTTDVPDARKYQVDIRPVGSDQWFKLSNRRWDTDLGDLATWKTDNYAPGPYEIRLTAVDHNNVKLVGTEACFITTMLTPN